MNFDNYCLEEIEVGMPFQNKSEPLAQRSPRSTLMSYPQKTSINDMVYPTDPEYAKKMDEYNNNIEFTRSLSEGQELGGEHTIDAIPSHPLFRSRSMMCRAPAVHEAVDPKIRGVRGVHQMNGKYGSRFQVRIWLKRSEYTLKSTENSKSKKASSGNKGGKRIHLGCFGSLATATHAYDIVEIFFRGKNALPNFSAEKYTNSPVLHFLINEVKQKNSVEEFMLVWKHIMPYRWVMDAAEPTPSVVEQLRVVKDKLNKYRLRHAIAYGDETSSGLANFLQILQAEQRNMLSQRTSLGLADLQKPALEGTDFLFNKVASQVAMPQQMLQQFPELSQISTFTHQNMWQY